MISIIIPIYNRASKLPQCLDSILQQTYGDYEVIISDYGSTDNLNQIVTDYQGKFPSERLRVVTQVNQGTSPNPARNHGAQEARGDYFLFCDVDLTLQPNMLELMLQALEEHGEVSFVYSSFKYGPKLFKLWPYDAEKLKTMPYIHTTALIRAEHFPGFDNDLKRLQDWDLWLTMLEQGHTGYWLDQVLFTAQADGIISSWLPSFVYKLMPWLSKVKKYNQAVARIKEKHNLQ
ncbi:MAG: glycosyltransferase family 2 protein [bacterium]